MRRFGELLLKRDIREVSIVRSATVKTMPPLASLKPEAAKSGSPPIQRLKGLTPYSLSLLFQ